MIYVIEGPDRCGKSTFINHLRNNILNPRQLIIHSSKPPKELFGDLLQRWTMIYYNELINNAIKLNNEGFDIILDRSWISETVYGPLYRNLSLPLNVLEHAIGENSHMFKLCIFQDDPIKLLSREDGESDAQNINDKTKELAAFTSAYSQTVIKKQFKFNWSDLPFRKDVLEEYAKIVIKS